MQAESSLHASNVLGVEGDEAGASHRRPRLAGQATERLTGVCLQVLCECVWGASLDHPASSPTHSGLEKIKFERLTDEPGLLGMPLKGWLMSACMCTASAGLSQTSCITFASCQDVYRFDILAVKTSKTRGPLVST